MARDLEESRTGSRDIPPRRPVLLLGPDAPRSASPVRAAAVQEGVDTPARGAARRRPRAPWRPVPRPRPAAPLARGRPRRAPRRSRATPRSPSAPRGRSGGWRRGPRSSSRSSGSARGSRASPTCREIGTTIATELRQLITYDNARVYRVQRREPRARRDAGPRRGLRRRDARGRCRRTSARGSRAGSPRFRVPQLVDDTANDPRAVTIPGTEDGPRRVDAARADGPRGRVPRRRRPVQARACASSPRTTCGCS